MIAASMMGDGLQTSDWASRAARNNSGIATTLAILVSLTISIPLPTRSGRTFLTACGTTTWRNAWNRGSPHLPRVDTFQSCAEDFGEVAGVVQHECECHRRHLVQLDAEKGAAEVDQDQ